MFQNNDLIKAVGIGVALIAVIGVVGVATASPEKTVVSVHESNIQNSGTVNMEVVNHGSANATVSVDYRVFDDVEITLNPDESVIIPVDSKDDISVEYHGD